MQVTMGAETALPFEQKYSRHVSRLFVCKITIAPKRLRAYNLEGLDM